MKRITSLVLSVSLLITMAFGLSFKAGATKKVFKASQKKVTVAKSKKKTITITNTIGTKISCKVSNKKICTVKLGKWKGSKIRLTIKGKKKGKTKITIKSNKTKKKIKILVKVKLTQPDLSLPKLPKTIKNYGENGEVAQKIKINKVSTFYDIGGTYFQVMGRAEYIADPEPYYNTYGGFTDPLIGYKIKNKKNKVVSSGLLWSNTNTLRFNCKHYYDLKAQEYKLIFTDVTYQQMMNDDEYFYDPFANFSGWDY